MITKNGVRLALVKAGFPGAASAIVYGGFVVMNHVPETVWVSWRQPDLMPRAEVETARADMLSQYAAELEGKGYTIVNNGYALIVTRS